MADPTNTDDSLQRAGREIQRRMLRAEKLKRIEEAEKGRLKATGWRPPNQIAVGRGGPTLRDAAQAIESMEEEKAALAAEAKRRLMQRAREQTADQGNVRRHAVDKAALEKDLGRIQAQMEQVYRNADNEGLVVTKNMLRRYLDGVGGTVYFRPEELRKYEAVKDAEKRVQGYYVDWMVDPPQRPMKYGRAAGITPPMIKAPVNRISPELRALRDGQSIWKSDYWTSNLQYPWQPLQAAKLLDPTSTFDRSDVDLQGFAGRSQIRGDGDFLFTRRGDKVVFTGVVGHKFDEPYNFETGTSFPTLDRYHPLREFKGEDARQLALYGRAKDFRMKSQWPQQAKGTLKINSDGTLSLEEIQWSDIDPYEQHPWP